MRKKSLQRNLLLIGFFFVGLAGADIISEILSKPSGLSIILTALSSVAFLVFATLAFLLLIFNRYIPPQNRE